jgi:hypothetical protein
MELKLGPLASESLEIFRETGIELNPATASWVLTRLKDQPTFDTIFRNRIKSILLGHNDEGEPEILIHIFEEIKFFNRQEIWCEGDMLTFSKAKGWQLVGISPSSSAYSVPVQIEIY